MTKVAVLDDWQGVAKSSADWSPLQARAEVVFFAKAFDNEDDAAAKLADFDIVLSMRERTPLPGSLINRLPKLRMLGMTGARNASLDTAACTARGIVVCSTSGGGNSEAALLAAFEGVMTGWLVDAQFGRGALDYAIKPVFPNDPEMNRTFGTAVTCSCGPDDNLALAAAMTLAQPGDVVMELNRQPIPNFDVFQRLADPIKPSDLALLLVNRQGNVMYIPIQGE